MARPQDGSRPTPAAPAASKLTRAHAIVLSLVAAAIVAIGVTYPMYDPDVWQHLRVGRTIWETHSIPRTDVWTWPGYGQPYVLVSWLFRAVLWPVYALGGEWGLTIWRWVTTIAMFGIAAATAWRMGARGVGLVVAIVWCGLLYRTRSMVRPETLACVLLAVQVWILESRRHGGRDRSIALVLIAWLWANTHISYSLALLLTGFHVIAAAVSAARRRPGARWPVRLAGILLASAAVCFANPFGWRTLWQPFQYALEWQHQPLYRMILELRPIVWAAHERDGLLAWMVLAPALCVWRFSRRRGDLVEALTYAFFISSALQAQRFLGFLTIAAAPFFARDIAELAGRIRVPNVLKNAWVRVLATAALMTAGAIPALTVAPWRPGLGIAWKALPVRACDWMEQQGIRGRSFAAFHQAGYLLWRFWPQRDRLPFMDTVLTGTRENQDLYAACWGDGLAWQKLDEKYHFDYVLLPRLTYPGQTLLDRMDADSTWAAVFMDDVAALFLRRDGPYAELAERWRYRIVPAGERAIPRMSAAFVESPQTRERLRTELERQASESEWTWRAHSGLATHLMAEGKFGEALEQLRLTEQIEPNAPQLRERKQRALAALTAPIPPHAEPVPGMAMSDADSSRRGAMPRPEDVETRRTRAVMFIRQARVEEAIGEYRAILAVDPTDIDAINNIAWIRATHAQVAHRDGNEAVRLAERARDLCPEPVAVVYSTLAAAYAEAGRYADAVQAGARAVELAQSAGQAEDAKRFSAQLDRYRAGRAFHFEP